jgi:hypothetical protein
LHWRGTKRAQVQDAQCGDKQALQGEIKHRETPFLLKNIGYGVQLCDLAATSFALC